MRNVLILGADGRDFHNFNGDDHQLLERRAMSTRFRPVTLQGSRSLVIVGKALYGGFYRRTFFAGEFRKHVTEHIDK